MEQEIREDFEDMTPQDFEDMRAWALDCEWRDLDENDIEDMSNEDLYELVDRNVEGGVKAFILAGADAPYVAETSADLPPALGELDEGMDLSSIHITEPAHGLSLDD